MIVFSDVMVILQFKAEITADIFFFGLVFKEGYQRCSALGEGSRAIPFLASRLRCTTITPLSTALHWRTLTHPHTLIYSVIIYLITVNAGTFVVHSQQKVADTSFWWFSELTSDAIITATPFIFTQSYALKKSKTFYSIDLTWQISIVQAHKQCSIGAVWQHQNSNSWHSYQLKPTKGAIKSPFCVYLRALVCHSSLYSFFFLLALLFIPFFCLSLSWWIWLQYNLE